MICPTIPKVEYCVTSSVSGYVTDGHSNKVLCTLIPDTQSRFVAISPTVRIPDNGVEITGPMLTKNPPIPGQIIPIPVNATNLELRSGGCYRLSPACDTLMLYPHFDAALHEVTLLYTAEATRTAPLIAVPEGVTLHWAGDTEPTWEAGKDYVIQLLQTAPTRIEARLFNAPTGANVGDGDYLIWEPLPEDATENTPLKLKKASLKHQRNGYYQFACGTGTGRQIDAAALSAALADCTFENQLYGESQFAGVSGGLVLKSATFENQKEVGRAIPSNAYLPMATYAKVTSLYRQFLNVANIRMPRATFAAVTDARQVFENTDGHIDMPSATFENVINSDIMFYVYRSGIELPSATFEKNKRATSTFLNAPYIYLPHLNLRSATDCTQAFYTQTPLTLENLKNICYGPRLQHGTDVPVDTVTTDDEGTPVAIAPEIVYASGTFREDDGVRPTGWGIQDFRPVNSDGDFIPYERGASTHSLGLHTPHGQADCLPEHGGTSASGAEYAGVLHHLWLRGWELTFK